ncbi:MAG: TIGR03663 family protein [Chloroflexi bacterium]|nr:TIGR03663 family protein [Chloroflexota bacterium]
MPSTTPSSSPKSLLESPAVMALYLNWEKIAWTALLLMALILRIYQLGTRVMSHDESLHTTYSYNLYAGIGFKHDPLMHGPLLFHLTAVSYFLLGPSDFSARLPAALLGVGVVWLLWMARDWLGKRGAFLAAALIALSPTMVYHSRYIRHDIYAIFFAVAVILLAFRYIDRGETKWLLWMSAMLGLLYTTKEVAFIYVVIFVAFFLFIVVWRVVKQRWKNQGLKLPFWILVVLGGLLTAYPLVETVKAPVDTPVVSARLGGMVMWPLFLIGMVLLAAAVVALWRGMGGERLRSWRELDVAMWMMMLSAPLFTAFPSKLFGGNPQSVQIATNMLQPDVLHNAIIFLVMLVLFGAVGYFWHKEQFLAGMGLFYGLSLLFFTTFFTNGNGVGTGLVGSMGYWLAQQEVARGGQPWFYYFMLMPLYEFIPLILSLLASVGIVWRLLRGQPVDPAAAANGNGFAVRREWLLFLVWWTAATWGAYTWAGEKMPWLTTHFAVPMAILGGWYLARKLSAVNWRSALNQGGLWLLLGVPLWLLALRAFTLLRPFQGASLDALSDTMAWIADLLLLVGLGWVLIRRGLMLGWPQARRMILFGLFAVLSLFSLRTMFMANFVNYDLPVEPLVYAHATPDIKLVVHELENISRATVGEGKLAFAYDDQTTWPFEWYFRNFPNKKFFGGSPSREVLKDAPVVLIGTENEEKVKPYLGNNYYRIPYRQIWWPKETYKQLIDGLPQADGTVLKGGKLLFKWLSDPEMRGRMWNIILYRRYDQPLADWDPADHFLMFVRKDIAAQVWSLGAAPAAVVEVQTDPFENKYRLESAVQIVGGMKGPGPGQLQQPRAAALAPDGRLYVADTGNHRIVVFNPDGSYAFDWGSFGEAQGQFNEPWGIAIGPDGRVYVSDTWNHRIQVFTADGTFIKNWGGFASTDGLLGQQGVFWGPRDLTFDHQGRLLVADTGNKRIQIFDAEGNAISQFGGAGLDNGLFDEPVGVAVDTNDNIYVSDAWNERIQKFDSNGVFLQAWPVPGWGDQGIFAKPYLAVDSTGTIYASDPSGWRILVWNPDGTPRAVLGQYGNTLTDFAWPSGVFVDDQDMLWVVDADNSRLMKFNPVRP